MGVISLKQITSEFLDEIQGGKHEFARAYRMAVKGWRELNWDVTGAPKTVKLDVECDLTIKLPVDYVSLISIGVVNGNGEIATLTENPRLTMEATDAPMIMTDDWWMYDTNLVMVGYRGSLGVGSNVNIGEYRVDPGSNRVILNPEFCYSQVTIEYLSNGTEEGKECIDEMASEALLSYVRWKWHIAKKNTTQGDKAMYRREYYNEKRKAKMRLRKLTLQVMNQASRENIKQSIKS